MQGCKVPVGAIGTVLPTFSAVGSVSAAVRLFWLTGVANTVPVVPLCETGTKVYVLRKSGKDTVHE